MHFPRADELQLRSIPQIVVCFTLFELLLTQERRPFVGSKWDISDEIRVESHHFGNIVIYYR